MFSVCVYLYQGPPQGVDYSGITFFFNAVKIPIATANIKESEKKNFIKEKKNKK